MQEGYDRETFAKILAGYVEKISGVLSSSEFPTRKTANEVRTDRGPSQNSRMDTIPGALADKERAMIEEMFHKSEGSFGEQERALKDDLLSQPRLARSLLNLTQASPADEGDMDFLESMVESVLLAFEKAGFGRGEVLKMLLGASGEQCPGFPFYPALATKHAVQHIGPLSPSSPPVSPKSDSRPLTLAELVKQCKTRRVRQHQRLRKNRRRRNGDINKKTTYTT